MEDFKYITIRGLIVKMLSVALLFVLVKDRSDLLYYGVYSVVGVVGGNIFNAFRLRKYIKFHLLELKRTSSYAASDSCLADIPFECCGQHLSPTGYSHVKDFLKGMRL